MVFFRARSPLQKYLLTIIAVGAAWFTTDLLERNPSPRFVVFTMAVVFAAWMGGFRAGALATLLSVVTINFSFQPPYNQFSFTPENTLFLLLFIAISLAISVMEETRQRAEQTLRQSEERFRAAQHVSLDGLTILESVRGADGKIEDFRWVYVNPAAGHFLKNTPEFLTGRRLLEVLPGNKDSSELFERYVRVVETGEASEGEIFYDADGIQGWFRNMTVRLNDGVLVSFRDITASKRNEQRITLLQEMTGDLVKAITPDQIMTLISGKAVDALGGNLGAIGIISEDGQNLVLSRVSPIVEENVKPNPVFALTDSYPITDSARTGEEIWLETLEAYIGRYPHVESILRTQTGSKSTATVPLIGRKGRIGALGMSFAYPRQFTEEDKIFFRALADYCAQALERAWLYESEREARRQAELANETRLRFFAVVSHELRTPLTSIKGFTTTLLATDVTWTEPQQREFLSVINDEADRLTELIDQLLDVSRLQTGTLKIDAQPRRFDAILEICQHRLEFITSSRDLNVTIPADLPPVKADDIRIAQVLINLVQNAVKYSPDGTPIRIQAQEVDQNVQVTVSDQGEGIPEAMRNQVFEPFYQLPNGKKGVGLGLAICKGMVEAHGGKIWIDSVVPHGTNVIFTLPAVKTS